MIRILPEHKDSHAGLRCDDGFARNTVKTLIFGSYLILATLAVKAKSAKLQVRFYFIFNILTYAHLNGGSDIRRSLRVFEMLSIPLYTTV